MNDNLTPPTPPCTGNQTVVLDLAAVEIETRSWPGSPVIRWLCLRPECGGVHETTIARRALPEYVRAGVRMFRHPWAEAKAALAGEVGRCGR